MVIIELIVFAAVALFIVARLYAAFGRKTGSMAREGQADAPRPTGEAPTPGARIRPAFTGPAAGGLEAIAAIDSHFSPEGFLTGARAAYEIIANAFSAGDKQALRPLLADDVFDAYAGAIDARGPDAVAPRFVTLRKADIVDAEVDGGTGKVSVLFHGSFAAADDNVSLEKQVWTFERDLRSRDPNWRLSAVAPAQ